MEYEIKTISDILKIVNHNNLENFLKDFELFLSNYVILKAMCKNDATCNEFTWIDDGKHNIEVNLVAKENVSNNHCI